MLTGNLHERDLLEGLCVAARTILEWILKKKGINRRNLIDSAQDRDYLRALMNVVMNFRVP